MPIEITMPKLTDTMTEATLARWLKKEGDEVKPGDMIAEVETDKATQELEAFDAGTVAKIVIPEGGKTAVGALIVVLAKPGEDVRAVAAGVRAAGAGEAGAAAVRGKGADEAGGKPALTAVKAPVRTPPASPAEARAEAPAEVEDHHEGSESEAPHTGGMRVSPLASKLAAELGVDLTAVRGTGPEGRIIKADVLAAAERPAAPGARAKPAVPVAAGPVAAGAGAGKLEEKTIPLSAMRQAIARRLAQSKRSIPHFYVSIDVLMDALMELRRQFNDLVAPEKISVTDFIARAVAVALTRVPALNASFAEDAIIRHGTVDLGIAVALEEGLVVPVIRGAEEKSVRELAREIKELAGRGRARKLKAEEMTGATFTISNLGMYGVKDFSAIVNPPESAILAVGGTAWQPVVKEAGGKREIVPAQVMALTLSADHRVVDGAIGAQFLQELKALLEAPLMTLV